MTERAGGYPNSADIDALPRDDGVTRRRFFWLAAGAVAAVGLAACTTEHHTSSTQATPAPEGSQGVFGSANPETDPNTEFLLQAGESLLALGEPSHGGLRFRSQIQDGHYQTDRDVGASSVGMGFLTLAKQFPNDPRWTAAARATATWLTAVSHEDGKGGRYWSDYVDDNDESSSHYTSFDDGTIGIADFYWQLYELTGDPKYRNIAMQGVIWTMSQAGNLGPSYNDATFRWKWDASDSGSPGYMGMGEGAVGIADTLALFRDRTQATDPAFAAKCQHYVDGALRYIDKVRNALGNNDGTNRALPETGIIGQDGDTTENSGYLSGAAGAMFMFATLAQHNALGGSDHKTEADKLLSWLNSTGSGPKVDFGDGTVAWKLALDPQDTDVTHYATGFEEGSAGIGWALLQAHKVTGERKYLTTAQQAGNWLLKVATKGANGEMSWREYENPPSSLIHANLNNGAAGIGMFLMDLYETTTNTDPTAAARYLAGARGARQWLMATAVHDGNRVYWRDYGRGDNNGAYVKDPSWHWGSAGIIAFLARMNGGSMDIPGEQSGL